MPFHYYHRIKARRRRNGPSHISASDALPQHQLELALALLEARDAFMHQTDKLLQTEEGRRALLEEARAALAEQLAVRGRAGRGGRPHAGGTGGDLTEADLQKHIDDMAAVRTSMMCGWVRGWANK